MREIDVSAGASGGRQLGKAAWHQAVRVAEELDAKGREIATTSELSDVGKQKLLSRAVRDAGVTLGKVRTHADKLRSELTDFHATYRSNGGEPNDVVSAAIWPKLPPDNVKVQILYRDAIQAGDWRTADAIESIPMVFEGRLVIDELDELRRERMGVDNPESLAALEAREESLAAVEIALAASSEYVGDVGKDLPDPDADDGSTVGGDGLLLLTPSQFEEALGAETQGSSSAVR